MRSDHPGASRPENLCWPARWRCGQRPRSRLQSCMGRYRSHREVQPAGELVGAQARGFTGGLECTDAAEQLAEHESEIEPRQLGADAEVRTAAAEADVVER